jgi:uncharacterized lipoprotein
MKRGFNVSTGESSQAVRRLLARTTLIVVAVSLISCSSYQGSSDNTWTASFFKDPDRVWNAIELVLIELDYEVAEENRSDGVIRAESEPAEDGTVVVLAIDQVMRTNDQVHVYVKPSFGGNAGSQNPDLLKAAADGFVKALEEKLKG